MFINIFLEVCTFLVVPGDGNHTIIKDPKADHF